MSIRAVLLTILIMITAGCGGDRDHKKMLSERRSEDPEVSEPGSDQEHWSVKGIIEPRRPEFEFRLIGTDSKHEVFNVRKIEIRRGDEVHPFQIIENLDTETSKSETFSGFVLKDMNFDGYNDFRLISFLPPGPNIPYLYWLYDPNQRIFRRNRDLEAITSPVIDGQKKEIRSQWSDGAAREGTDVYRFIKQKPVLVRQEIKEYEEPGKYLLTIRERNGGKMIVTDKRAVREHPE